MQIRMVESEQALNAFSWERPQVFIGNAVDGRGDASVAFCRSLGESVSIITYNPIDMSVIADEQSSPVDQFSAKVGFDPSVPLVLDATTLGFAELFIVCNSAFQAGIRRIGFVYVEPESYARASGDDIRRAREFNLSQKCVRYRAIPGRGYILDQSRNQRIVFFLGYEGSRLDNALENLRIAPDKCDCVIGLPAFRPGWEMDTFENNVDVLNDKKLDEPFYCGADSPEAAYRLLTEMKKREAESEFFVAPIGTKPHGLGTVLFALENPDVGLLYDHPILMRDRSVNCGTWHFFEARF